MATKTENPLLTLLASNPHPLLQPTSEHHAAALALAKTYLDPVARWINETQTERQQRLRRKRKRGRRDEGSKEQPLRLRELYVDGFQVGQVHAQVKRVLQAATKEIEIGSKSLEEQASSRTNEFEEFESGSEAELLEEDGYHTDATDEELSEDAGSLPEADEASPGGLEDPVAEDEDEKMNSEYSHEESADDQNGEPDVFIEDKHGLNDGFFSIDDFNRQTDFLEQVDARGDPNDGGGSDEEDVDWGLDPLTLDISKGLSQRDARDDDSASGQEDDDDDDDDDEEGGATFGNMDLNAPEGMSDDDNDQEELDVNMDDVDNDMNANNVMYKDFFAPPARKGARKGKRGPPMAHNFPSKSTQELARESDAEEEVSRTMAAVRRDLFDEAGADEAEASGSDAGSDLDEFDPRSRRSAHQRRQAKLLAEIRRLEAENVAKREWTMSGEARAADRPLNSLLEEDLNFERTGKPVPVITQEVSEDIEALIKRRIIAREFDEVRRRRPDELLTGPLGRRGALEEVSDAKSKKSLAELYEEDHLKKTDPNYVDPRSEKLKATHREIENLWRDIAGKLDSLCSWHYRPRPIEMSVQVRTDAPVVTLEDARPSGVGGEMDMISQLAPQEIYRAGQDKDKDEVVTKGGTVVGRNEMSRDEKKSRRARAKERARKAGEMGNRRSEAKRNDGEKNKPKKGKNDGIVGDLKKGGVMVIGRKGELVDVEGKEMKARAGVNAGALRL